MILEVTLSMDTLINTTTSAITHHSMFVAAVKRALITLKEATDHSFLEKQPHIEKGCDQRMLQ